MLTFLKTHQNDKQDSTFCLGTDGIIIVDTTESGDAALKILKEFRKLTSKPMKAIIQTHFHGGKFGLKVLEKLMLFSTLNNADFSAVGLVSVIGSWKNVCQSDPVKVKDNKILFMSSYC